ncbi:MAG: XdhC family protein [Parvularculales bacterium]
MRRSLLKQIVSDKEHGRPVVLATNLTDHTQKLIYPTETKEINEITTQAAQTLKTDTALTADSTGGQWFTMALNPPLRLVIIGAVHIAQALSAMAALTGYEVIIIDPREAFATQERFPNSRLMNEWPDEALKTVAPDHRTALVTLTHDPKLDDPALSQALGGECFYIAALGSRKTHQARLERLKKTGHDDKALARICGPAGLALGARSPAEIAISILAQMTEVLRT